ncbi:monooxygenase 2-like isoform X3 [Magnolia sinica]|uniref:monooxygenase 2-like isoform X3 n=1 Tax=Magnolia sinica TaxID=86752 RepID=UPI00265B50F9|nr:monooxygenase 2-like isoform X3 [Magnolia sinica]
MAVHKVVIVGAGIAGLATAVALKRVGIPALVLERSHELRATGAALTLTPNAWRALDALGVAHKLTSIYTPFQKEGLEVRSVHRRALLKALAEELPTATIRFSSKLMSIRTETLQDLPVYVVHMDGEQVVKTKVLIGCDGVHSVIAQWLGLSAPVHSGRAAVRGLAIFPEGHGLNHEVQQIIGDGGRGAFVPLTDKDIYWAMTYKSSMNGGEWARDPELIQKYVLENLAKNFPPVYLDVVRHSDLPTLTSAPLMFRLPWDLIFKNACKGTVTVAGDAMHPMTPDLGQGGCSALEDAVVLGRNIRNSLLENGKFEQKRVEEGLKKYVKERRWRVSGLIAGAYLSGWIQQESSGWLMKFIREKIFYGLIYNKLADAIHYDCGKLPSASSLENAPE